MSEMAARQVLRFSVVGGSAAAVHYLSVIVLVSVGAIRPLYANILAFAVAFWVSYAGHRYFTFTARERHGRTLPRFFAVALGSFLLNQLLFASLLRYCAFLPYYVSLAIVLVAVAALTFVVSRRWAFATSPVPATRTGVSGNGQGHGR